MQLLKQSKAVLKEGARHPKFNLEGEGCHRVKKGRLSRLMIVDKQRPRLKSADAFSVFLNGSVKWQE